MLHLRCRCVLLYSALSLQVVVPFRDVWDNHTPTGGKRRCGLIGFSS